jgi:hypothetical protein
LVSDDRDRSENTKAARLARLQPDAAERMATNDEFVRIRQENFETLPLPSDILANDEIRECTSHEQK